MGFVLSFIRCIKLAKNAEPPPLKRSKFLALGQQAFIHYFGWCLKNTLRPLFSHVPVAASDLCLQMFLAIANSALTSKSELLSVVTAGGMDGSPNA